jgi:ribose/xylose/arabinose/galactoside ABC-type transport system permease subunit
LTVATGSAGAAARLSSAVGWIVNRREGSVIVGLISIYLIGLIVDPGPFLTLRRVNNILQNAAQIALLGYGVALLMITAEFDLSVESVLALSGGMALVMMSGIGINGPTTVLIILVFAALFGITQGLIVTQLNLPSLIVTIGTLTGVRGVLQIVIGGTTISVLQDEKGILTWFGGNVELGDFPGLAQDYVFTYRLPLVHDATKEFSQFSIAILWAFLFLVVFHYLLFYTRFGYHVRATGDNVESAGTTGIDPEIVKIACFGIVSVMAGFAGLAFAGRAGAIQVQTAADDSLFAIAAVVLGGTKLTGGRGSMVGVLLGAVVLQTADSVLRALGLGVSGWQAIITGMFIVAAVGLDTVFRGVSVDLIRRWYVVPTREILTSPSGFFETKAVRRTASDMYGYLFMSIGVTAVLTNVVAFVVGVDPVQSALFDGLSEFKLVLEGNWPETIVQVYLFLLLVAVVSFVVIELVTQRLGRAGDYESTLAIACYSMVLAPLLSVPIVVYGFNIFFVGDELLSSLIIAVPILLGMAWLMYVGTAQLHELPRKRALASTGSVILVWLLLSGILAWSLMAV